MGDGSTARALAAAPRTTPSREQATPADVAWLAAIPCAALVVALVVALGPPLGRALFVERLPAFWPFLYEEGMVFPEPAEHARFLLALLGPPLLAVVVLIAARRAPASRAIRPLVWLSQLLVLGAAIGCVVAQHTLRSIYATFAPRSYFTWTTLAVGALLALAGCAVLASPPLLRRLHAASAETRVRRVGALALAGLFTAVWLLPAINTEGSVGLSNIALYVNVPFWLDESFGVLNGLAPFATFDPQYSHLWPYAGAAAMALFGASFTVYAATMAAATGAAMLAVFALLRRLAGSSLIALALFAAFVATSFFTERGPLDLRWGPVNAFSMFPMRFSGPYVLAWLTVRHLDGARWPRRVSPLFAVAWLVALNNIEFGIPALAASLLAVALTDDRPTWRGVRRLAAELALGLLVALAIVSALTLAVAGRLPDPDLGRLFVFARLYGVDGFGDLPISPAVGLHLAIYATYVAALVLAWTRTLEGHRRRSLTGALAWAGVFGLGTGAYFAGRSHPDVLISLFSPWALTLALLAIAAVGEQLARGSRLPSPAVAATLLGLGVVLCSVAQIPRPWDEVARIGRSSPVPAFRPLDQERFVAQRTRRHERIAILGPLGHRIAYDVGISDVMPYATLESMPTRESFTAMLAGLQRAHVRKAFLILVQTTTPDHLQALRDAGWREVDRSRAVIELLHG